MLCFCGTYALAFDAIAILSRQPSGNCGRGEHVRTVQHACVACGTWWDWVARAGHVWWSDYTFFFKLVGPVEHCMHERSVQGVWMSICPLSPGQPMGPRCVQERACVGGCMQGVRMHTYFAGTQMCTCMQYIWLGKQWVCGIHNTCTAIWWWPPAQDHGHPCRCVHCIHIFRYLCLRWCICWGGNMCVRVGCRSDVSAHRHTGLHAR